MAQISAMTLVVPDYEEAIAFYVGCLGFSLLEDTQLSDNKRWVRVSPDPSVPFSLLLAEAADAAQRDVIGQQAGGRVFLFLTTDDFDADYAAFGRAGVTFLEEPRSEPYGKVVVFADPFGNKWDLIEPVQQN